MILNQKLKRLFLLALLAGSLTGCFDRRRAVALGTFVIPDGRFHQEICWAEIAGLKVTHGEGRIVNVETIIGGLGC